MALFHSITVRVMVAQVYRFVIKFDLGTELAIASFNQGLGKIDVLVADIILVQMLQMAFCSVVTDKESLPKQA